MAAIDKIYGNVDNWIELYVWLKQAKPQYIRHMYPCPPVNIDLSQHDRSEDKEYPISNFPEEADRWLLKNCPISFVIEAIKEQYGDSIDELKE